MKHQALLSAVLLTCALAAVAPSCSSLTDPPPGDGNCVNDDGALDNAAFVIATTPLAGARVASGFPVSGCSRTFEGNVQWRLTGGDGSELASGFTQGGGVDGPGPFSFNVTYSVAEPDIGHLEVFEEDVSDGEGRPPGRTVLPLVLLP